MNVEVDRAIELLLSMFTPTHNRLTDKFGFYRFWGNNDWTPDKEYSPIHAGIDFSARGDKEIKAPCNGYAYGQEAHEPVGSITMIRPIVDNEALDNVVVTLMHCEPAKPQWKEVRKGEIITTQAGHGIGAAHLHLEIDVTEDVYKELVNRHMLYGDELTDRDIKEKATESGIDPDKALLRVEDQKNTWGISFLGKDGFIRKWGLPHYRQSSYSRVGNEPTVMINPLRLINF